MSDLTQQSGADVPLDPRRVPIALLVLAMPIIASMVSRTAMSFVDFIMVSQLGTAAQAAILPASMLLFCVIAFGMGVLSVINSFVAQSLGRGDTTGCAAYGWQGVHLSLVMGVLLLPTWFVVPALFEWIGHAPEVQAMEVSYVRIGLLGIAPTLAGMALGQFFNGIHQPAVGFWSALVANVFNIAANYALIFGHWGFEAMGIAGAAWATALAAAVQMLITMAWMLRPTLARRYHTWAAWRPDVGRMIRIIRFGLPAGVQHVVDIFAFTLFTLVLVGRFGTVQLAANNLAFKFVEVSFMPTVGLGIAVTAMVGRAIGQGRPDLARLVTRWAAGIGLLYMGGIGALFLVARHELVGLLTDDPAVAAWAGRILLICAVFQVFDALGIIHSHALRGAGDTYWPAIASAIFAAALFLGGGALMAYLLPGWGAIGPWIAATTYIIFLGIILWARFAFGPWHQIDLLGARPATA